MQRGTSSSATEHPSTLKPDVQAPAQVTVTPRTAGKERGSVHRVKHNRRTGTILHQSVNVIEDMDVRNVSGSKYDSSSAENVLLSHFFSNIFVN